jgi:hypothetical protein
MIADIAFRVQMCVLVLALSSTFRRRMRIIDESFWCRSAFQFWTAAAVIAAFLGGVVIVVAELATGVRP